MARSRSRRRSRSASSNDSEHGGRREDAGPAPVCLRCAKLYVGDPGLVCKRPNKHQNCTVCRRKNKKCLDVPKQFLRRLKRVQDAAAKVIRLEAASIAPGLSPTQQARADSDHIKAREKLWSAQSGFTRRVEAYLRKDTSVSFEQKVLRALDCHNYWMEHLVIIAYKKMHKKPPPDPSTFKDTEEEDDGEAEMVTAMA
ncbi:hypothetical protein GP486_005733 [Trichoglossum hirsutum]|uniref:Uncharacterized protein n=1 Tax=Trichoglossum hirsutum TaxID=265104 RepID=A0A9P8RLP8_9PEZI|nr:hypothetical protein GP486_005733 [Trichoglossum hirsutum]